MGRGGVAAHADLERRGEVWTIVDDGRSRNGSFVNGERHPAAAASLHHGDVIAIGKTPDRVLRAAARARRQHGRRVAARAPDPEPAQRRVLVALCRPFSESRFAAPPSTASWPRSSVVSVETVKFHLHALFALFGLDELPQHRKRATLARQALERGVILPRDIQG